MLVRIGQNIWEVSPGDMKRFGHDSYALRLRAKTAKIVFTTVSGEWFKSTPTLEHSFRTMVTTRRTLNKIASAIVLEDR